MPSGRRWSCGVEIGEYHGVLRLPRRVLRRRLPERPTEAAPAAVDRGREWEMSGRDPR
jgi:hypothetical protein